MCAALDRALTRPQILHMHRAPSARPPAAVSYLFTGLAAAPLGVLVVLLGSVGINFDVSCRHCSLQRPHAPLLGTAAKNFAAEHGAYGQLSDRH